MPLSKVSKSLSFYTLKDASGSIQLVAARRQLSTDTSLESLSQIPPESSVVVEGELNAKPLFAQRFAQISVGSMIPLGWLTIPDLDYNIGIYRFGRSSSQPDHRTEPRGSSTPFHSVRYTESGRPYDARSHDF
jgi:hypothetical protein